MNPDLIVVHYNDKEYMRILNAVIKRIVGDQQTTEDVVHNAFLKMLRYKEDPEEKDNLPGWIMFVAKQCAWKEIKQRARFPFDGEAEVISPDPWGFESALNFRVITATIDALPPNQAEVARMRLIGDMSFKQIAETTGRSLDAVDKNFRQGRRNLQRELAELR